MSIHKRFWGPLLVTLLALVVTLPMLPGAASTPAQARTSGPFTCDSTLYIMQHEPTQLYTIDRSMNPFGLTPVGSPRVAYNAIGFNPVDNYIYGIDPNDALRGTIYRIDSDGFTTSLGIPTGFPAANGWISGTILEDGTYVVSNTEPGNRRILTIDLTTSPPTIINNVPLSGGFFIDFAVNPLDGVIYGYNRLTHRVATVNPGTGVVTDFGVSYAATPVAPGSAFFDVYGVLYLYGSVFGTIVQDRFYSVDVGDTINGLGTGELTEISTGPAVTISDGTSCAFGIAMQKTVEPSPAVAGSVVTYTYRIANQSEDTVAGFDFTDTMDAGRTYVAGSLVNPLGGTPNAYGGTATLTITDLTLAPNAISTIAVDVQIPVDAVESTVFNQATLTGGPPEFAATIPSDYPISPGYPDPTPLEIIRPADLAVTKTESIDPVAPGGNVTYTVTVTNNGPADATGVELSEALTLPAGVTVSSVTPSGTTTIGGASPTYTWTVGNLANGASETLIVSLAVSTTTASGTDVIGNTAAISAVDQIDQNPNNNSATVNTSVALVADLEVTKVDSTDPVQQGQSVSYTVTVTNLGPATATGVVIAESMTLPDGVTVESVTPGGATTVSGDAPNYTWTIGTLANGASETLVVVLAVDPDAPTGSDIVSNTASVAAMNETDPNPVNNWAVESTTIRRARPNVTDPALSKIGVLLPGQLGLPGESLTWIITVEGDATATLTNVVIEDVLRDELRVDEVRTTSGTVTVDGQTVTATIPVLNPGEVVTIEIDTTVLESPIDGRFLNTATMDADGGFTTSAAGVVSGISSLPSTGYPPQ